MCLSFRILLVDDSEDNAKSLISDIIEDGSELTVKRIDNAKDMRTALTQDWDVVIANYHLPSFNGIDVINLMEKINYDVPLILL
jgi:DNA-binding NtrC family response regulator